MIIIFAKIDVDFFQLSENINIALVLSKNRGIKLEKPRFFSNFKVT